MLLAECTKPIARSSSSTDQGSSVSLVPRTPIRTLQVGSGPLLVAKQDASIGLAIPAYANAGTVRMICYQVVRTLYVPSAFSVERALTSPALQLTQTEMDLVRKDVYRYYDDMDALPSVLCVLQALSAIIGIQYTQSLGKLVCCLRLVLDEYETTTFLSTVLPPLCVDRYSVTVCATASICELLTTADLPGFDDLKSHWEVLASGARNWLWMYYGERHMLSLFYDTMVSLEVVVPAWAALVGGVGIENLAKATTAL